MIYFGEYLKDYLESVNISQSEFALRLGITQKHMNEILNGKKNITLEMASNIERLTKIPGSFIMSIERDRILYDELMQVYKTEQALDEEIKKKYCFKELVKNNWIKFKDKYSVFQNTIDILDFLNVRDFKVLENLKEYVLFKKNGEDYNKLALWIARCDQLCETQKVNIYDNNKFNELINELKDYSFKKGFELSKIQEILNNYGIYFICEKALPGTKVRGCFKVRNTIPAIYITGNYASKDSLYFELFHELGHCKSDYTIARSKVLADGDEEREKRADEFAIKTMIDESIWNKIIENFSEENIIKISKNNKISPSFIVGRLAKNKYIKYDSELYNKYRHV